MRSFNALVSSFLLFTLLLSLALTLLAGCEGALGGNIGRTRSTEVTSGDTTSPERERSSSNRRSRPDRPAPREQTAEADPTAAEPPVERDEAPTSDPLAEAPTTPPQTTSSGGGRGRRGGGKRGGGSAVVSVTHAGDAAAGTAGTLTGTVLFEGTVPKRSPLPLIATTQGCAEHSETPQTEDVIVTDGRVANVVVRVRKLPAGVSVPPPPTDPFILDQVGCMYVPHVSAVQAGRPVHARNSDALSHNVHVFATLNEAPNRTVAEGGAPVQLAFESTEAVKFKCDLHPWMSAHLYVVEHPWFAVTSEDGTWTIADLPPGEYELEAWHERLKNIKSKRFTIGPGGEVEVEFTYKQ